MYWRNTVDHREGAYIGEIRYITGKEHVLEKYGRS